MKQTLARVIRANMDLSGHTYRTLCNKLREQFAIEHNPDTLRNKVTSGALGAQMFLFMMMAMEVEDISISQIQKMYLKLEQERE